MITEEKILAKDAGRMLARLMERELGYDYGQIDNIALRLFIQAYWGRVSVLAHAIHDNRQDESKANSPIADWVSRNNIISVTNCRHGVAMDIFCEECEKYQKAATDA